MIFLREKINSIFWKKGIPTIFFFLLILFFPNNAFTQRPGQTTDQNPTSGARQKGAPVKAPRKISKDSLLIFYYFIENPNQEFPYQDTLIDNNFHQFDPARRRLLDYGALGYMGSPLQPLFYQPSLNRGFDVGLHQYDLYKIHVDDLRFYNLKRAYSDFYFTQGGSQDDIQLKAKFSRNFSKNMNLSLDYHRISQYGTNDAIAYFYQNQRARHTALAGGITLKNNTNTYQGFLAFSNNVHQQEDNGGIQSAADFLDQEDGFSSTLAIPVWLDDAETRHSEQEISYTQYYIYNPKEFKENKKRKAKEKAKAKLEAKAIATAEAAAKVTALDTLSNSPNSISPPITDSLKTSTLDSLESPKLDSLKTPTLDTLMVGTSDSIRNQRPIPPPPNRSNVPPRDNSPKSRSYTLSHRLTYKKGTYKFSDITAAADSLYWKNLLLDQRSLRHFVETRKIENTFAISTFKPRKKGSTNIKLQSDLFEIGIRHSIHWIDEEAADSTVNNLFLTGKWNFNPNERLKVETYAHLGLWDNAGDYRVSGDLFFDLKKLGQLQLSGLNQLYRPNLLQQRFYISERSAWNNDFKPTLATTLGATYSLPKWGFQASGQYHLLNNFIYFDTLVTPQQEGSAMSVFQLILQQNFKIKNFHLDNVIIFQETTNDVLQLPNIYSKHSLYYDGRWFKKALKVRIGFDLRMNNNYFANSYNPLIGQFYLQNSEKVKFFPALDGYANIRVKQFRFFAKFENFTRAISNLFGSIPNDTQYYQIASYPMQNNRFRMGLAWKFAD